jgi:isopenicillin-N epimerase
MVNRE